MSVSQQFAVFVIVGLVATACHYAVLIILVQRIGAEATLASTAGYGVGAVVSYVLNRTLTFRSQRTHLSALPRFAATVSGGFLINAALIALFVHGAGVYYLIAQVVSTAIVLFWNFAVNKYWTFAVSPGTTPGK